MKTEKKKIKFADSIQKQLIATIPLWIIFSFQFNNVLFLFIPIIIFTLTIIAFVYSTSGIKNIECSHNVVSGAMEGEEVQVKLNVKNLSSNPVWLLEISDKFEAALLPDKKLCVSEFLNKGYQCEVRYKDSCMRKRGLYNVGPLRIFLEDPLGFFLLSKVSPDLQTLAVYPTAYHISATGSEITGARKFYSVEKQSSLFAGTSHLYLGSRPYRRGDDLRYVNWHQTARKGNLIVKEMESEVSGLMTISLDLFEDNRAGLGMKSIIEYQVKICSSLARFASEKNIFFQIIAKSDDLILLPFGSGRDHYLNALRTLINIEQNGTVRMEYFLRTVDYLTPNNSTLFLIFSSLNLDVKLFSEAIKSMRQRGISIFAIFFDNQKFTQIEYKKTKPLDYEIVSELCEQLGVKSVAIAPDSNLRESINSLLKMNYL